MLGNTHNGSSAQLISLQRHEETFWSLSYCAGVISPFWGREHSLYLPVLCSSLNVMQIVGPILISYALLNFSTYNLLTSVELFLVCDGSGLQTKIATCFFFNKARLNFTKSWAQLPAIIIKGSASCRTMLNSTVRHLWRRLFGAKECPALTNETYRKKNEWSEIIAICKVNYTINYSRNQ